MKTLDVRSQTNNLLHVIFFIMMRWAILAADLTMLSEDLTPEKI